MPDKSPPCSELATIKPAAPAAYLNKGELPEINVIQMGPRGENRATCLFTGGGHGGPIPRRIGELLWLAVIYGVDPEEYDGWDVNTKADLKKLAKQVLLNDPYSGLSRNADSTDR